MRKLIFAINTTLDGCVDHTKQFVDEEASLEYFTPLLREADLQVFGRKTYQLMVPYWPEVLKDPSATKADTEFARHLTPSPKLFFHGRWTALKIEIRGLFVRTFATK